MHPPETRTAKQISEYLLRETARALMTHDFDLARACFALPQTIKTMGQQKVIVTVSEFREMFLQICALYERKGVTAFERTCVAAEYSGPDTVKATHVNRIMVGADELSRPYPVYSVLVREDGVWRVSSADYALEDDAPESRVLLCLTDPDPEARALFQDFLDRMSDAVMADDLEGFADGIALPFSMVTETDSVTLTDRTGIERLFRDFVTRFGATGNTLIVRIARRARFVSPDEIAGIHDSHQLIGGVRVIPPYPNRVRLLRGTDGAWRSTGYASAIFNTAETFGGPVRINATPVLPDFGRPAQDHATPGVSSP